MQFLSLFGYLIVYKNVLYRDTSIDSITRTSELTRDKAQTIIAASLKALKVWRDANRPRPHLDDKVVTSWNGLMVRKIVSEEASLTSRDADLGLCESPYDAPFILSGPVTGTVNR